MKTIVLILFLLFAQESLAAPERHNHCLTIGLLGEFKRPTGSTSEPFGNEILRGSDAAVAWLKGLDFTRCISLEKIDIDNSIANIDGTIRRAADRGIHYFVGLGISSQALAARRAIRETESVLITPTASASSLAQDGERIILLFPNNSQIASAISHYVWNMGVRKIVSIYASNDAYSSELSTLFGKAFVSNGGSFRAIAIRSGSPDFSEAIASIRELRPTHVFLPLFELDAAKAVYQLNNAFPQLKLVGSDAWGTYSTVVNGLLKQLGKEVIVPLIYDPQANGEMNRFLLKQYIAKGDGTPTDLGAFSFDAIIITDLIEKKCGDRPKNTALNRCLDDLLPVETTTGRIMSRSGLSLQRTVHMIERRIGGTNAPKG